MDYLIIPDTGIKLYENSIVILSRFPGTRWITKNGWYTYNCQQYQGWYFCSIPAQTVVPVTEEDLRLLTIVSNDGCSSGSGSGQCPGPYPPGPGPNPGIPFTPRNAYELDRAWLTVDTLAQRNELNQRLLPDGKIVRVNDDGTGSAKYYRWDQPTCTWKDETFGIDLSPYLTIDDTNKLYPTYAYVEQSINEHIQAIDVPGQILDAIESNEAVDTAINDKIDKATEPIKEDINQNEQHISNVEQLVVNQSTAVTNLGSKVTEIENNLETVQQSLEWIQLT